MFIPITEICIGSNVFDEALIEAESFSLDTAAHFPVALNYNLDVNQLIRDNLFIQFALYNASCEMRYGYNAGANFIFEDAQNLSSTLLSDTFSLLLRFSEWVHVLKYNDQIIGFNVSKLLPIAFHTFDQLQSSQQLHPTIQNICREYKFERSKWNPPRDKFYNFIPDADINRQSENALSDYCVKIGRAYGEVSKLLIMGWDKDVLGQQEWFLNLTATFATVMVVFTEVQGRPISVSVTLSV